MLDRETARSQKISKELTKAIMKERRRGDKLQRQLAQTREVVKDLTALATELGVLYVNAHEDDSVLGNIGTAAMTPVKVVQNTLSLNLCFGRDKRNAEKMYKKKLDEIKERYDRIFRGGVYPPKPRGLRMKEPKLRDEKNK